MWDSLLLSLQKAGNEIEAKGENNSLSSINPFLQVTAEIETNPSTRGSEISPPMHVVFT